MTNWIEKIPGWMKSALVGAIAFIAGFVTNYYVDYRNNYVSALNTNYDQFDKASQDLSNSLKVFADISDGQKAKRPEDVDKLEKQLIVALSKVEDLSRRIDDNRSGFVKNYQDAAIKLRNAAEEVQGPANGKVMVLAANDFLLAENEVRDAVLNESTSFLWRSKNR
jgi:hypothetical protein